MIHFHEVYQTSGPWFGLTSPLWCHWGTLELLKMFVWKHDCFVIVLIPTNSLLEMQTKIKTYQTFAKPGYSSEFLYAVAFKAHNLVWYPSMVAFQISSKDSSSWSLTNSCTKGFTCSHTQRPPILGGIGAWIHWKPTRTWKEGTDERAYEGEGSETLQSNQLGILQNLLQSIYWSLCHSLACFHSILCSRIVLFIFYHIRGALTWIATLIW